MDEYETKCEGTYLSVYPLHHFKKRGANITIISSSNPRQNAKLSSLDQFLVHGTSKGLQLEINIINRRRPQYIYVAICMWECGQRCCDKRAGQMDSMFWVNEMISNPSRLISHRRFEDQCNRGRKNTSPLYDITLPLLQRCYRRLTKELFRVVKALLFQWKRSRGERLSIINPIQKVGSQSSSEKLRKISQGRARSLTELVTRLISSPLLIWSSWLRKYKNVRAMNKAGNAKIINIDKMPESLESVHKEVECNSMENRTRALQWNRAKTKVISLEIIVVDYVMTKPTCMATASYNPVTADHCSSKKPNPP